MAIQLSTTVRNARLDAIETTVGVSAILRIRDGALPANCAAADAGAVLAELNLPSDWMAAASGGTKGILGTWQDLSANNSGTATHFRIYDSGGSTCHMQGTVGTAATDMIVTSTAFTAGASFTITSFTLTDGNA
jgi:hypothetical protein